MAQHDTLLPKGMKVQGGYAVGYAVGFRRLTDEDYQRDMAEWIPPYREGVLHTHRDMERPFEARDGDSYGWKYTGTVSKYYHTYKCVVEGCEATEARLCNRFSKREEECKCDVTT